MSSDSDKKLQDANPYAAAAEIGEGSQLRRQVWTRDRAARILFISLLVLQLIPFLLAIVFSLL